MLFKTNIPYLISNRNSALKLLRWGLFFLFIGNQFHLQAQNPSRTSLSQPFQDSLKQLNQPDTTIIPLDSVQFSRDSLEAPVEYNAEDSMVLDAQKKIMHLYGNASVSYLDFGLKSAYIAFDMENKLVYAEGLPDSSGRKSGHPQFSDKTQSFTAKRIKYNFDTRKGIIYDVTTQQQGGYIHGGRAMIQIAPDSIKTANDKFFSEKAIFTTCDHEVPHFGIRSTKQKFIPNKMVIVGPSNLEIMGIPMPLWLPFGFFPINSQKSSGLLFPRDYEFSPNFGFGLRGIGWYFDLGDHMDLRATGDIYTRGSWGINLQSNYRKRYKYSGGMTLGYSYRLTGDPQTPTATVNRSTQFRWNWRQDPKAHPTQTFSVNVNIQSGGYLRLNSNNATDVLTNTLSSNISYNKRWNGKPFRLSLSATHSQNTNTGIVNITLPQLDFKVSRIEPFKNKKGGQPKWYNKLGFTYSLQARNSISAADSALFLSETLDNLKFGVKHSVPFGTSFRVLKYFNVSPSINYTEKWYINSLQKTFNDTLVVARDTIFDSEGIPTSITNDTTFGLVESANVMGFKSLREFNAGISISTQIFGTLNNLKIGRLRAIRHVIKPSISYNFTPDYTDPFWGYFDEVQLDSRYPEEVEQYSIFQGGIYGSPSSAGLSSSMSFSVNNIFEAKVLAKGDTTGKMEKIRLVDNLTFSGSYNFAADSLNMSTLRLRGSTRLFKKINVAFSTTFDPYAANPDNNRRINVFEWNRNRRLARLTNASFTVSTALRWDEIKNILDGKSTSDEEEFEANRGGQMPRTQQNRTQKDLAIVDNVRLGYDLRLRQQYINGVDSTFLSTHTLSLSGRVNLTNKWRITIGRVGYDFISKQITYPDFQFYRDLHCWEMGASWQPSRNTYSFFIRVRQPPLDFINIPYGRNNYDVFSTF